MRSKIQQYRAHVVWQNIFFSQVNPENSCLDWVQWKIPIKKSPTYTLLMWYFVCVCLCLPYKKYRGKNTHRDRNEFVGFNSMLCPLYASKIQHIYIYTNTNHANTISHHNKMNIENKALEIVYIHKKTTTNGLRNITYKGRILYFFLSVTLCSNLKIWILKLFECVTMMMMMLMIRLSIFSMGYVCRHVEKAISLTRKYEIVVWRLK